jgi:hypothetical protein
MNLQDNLLNFFSGNADAPETDIKHNLFNDVNIAGLCPVCENRSHCMWVETTKIHCEHYE